MKDILTVLGTVPKPPHQIRSHSDQATLSILLQSLRGLSNFDTDSDSTFLVNNRLVTNTDTGKSAAFARNVKVTIGTLALGRAVTGEAGPGHGPPGDTGGNWLPFQATTKQKLPERGGALGVEVAGGPTARAPTSHRGGARGGERERAGSFSLLARARPMGL